MSVLPAPNNTVWKAEIGNGLAGGHLNMHVQPDGGGKLAASAPTLS